MSRKPLLPKYAGEPFEIGARAIERRPEFVAAIGKCLALWPYVEHQMAVTLGVFLGVESSATTAVFSTLRTGRAQRDALNAAAEHILSPDMLSLFEAILGVVNISEKARADIAHGNWGILTARQDVVTWVESKFHSADNARGLNGAWPREGHAFLLDHTFVYALADLEEVYEQLEFTWKLLHDFLTLHRSQTTKSPFRDVAGPELFAQLTNEPRVAAARTRLDRRQSRT